METANAQADNGSGKGSFTRRGALCVLLCVAVATAGMPRYAAAQDAAAGSGAYNVQAAAMVDGERDADADSSGATWLAVGCLLGILGVIIGYVVEPSPPPTRMLGKSPDYVIAYSAAYKHAGKQAQGKKAMLGCVLGSAIGAAIYFVAVSAAASSTGTTY